MQIGCFLSMDGLDLDRWREGEIWDGFIISNCIRALCIEASGIVQVGFEPAEAGKDRGDLAQMVERSLSMREALGSIPWFSTFMLTWTAG